MPDEPSKMESAKASQETVQDAVGGDAYAIDVRSIVRQASTRVEVQQLTNRKSKNLLVLSVEKLDELVRQTVTDIVARHHRDSSLAPGIVVEAQKEFVEVFSQYQAAVMAKNELQAAKESLGQELDQLKTYLEQQKLPHVPTERRAPNQSRVTPVSDLKTFEIELKKIVAQVFDCRRSPLEVNGRSDSGAVLWKVEERFRAVVAQIVRAEIERAPPKDAAYQGQKIVVLEKRIQKLCQQIGALEGALSTIANSKPYSSQQFQSLVRQIGLWQEDKNHEKKRGILRVVLQENLEIQRGLRKPAATKAGSDPGR
jgi:hypothetical protein